MATPDSSNYASLNSDFSGWLTPERSQAIFEKVAEGSMVQQLARQVDLGPSGREIPVFTQDPTANWVSEGEEKSITKGGMNLQTMQPQKIAAIFTASAETVRANPGGYMDSMRDKVAASFAKAFDSAALYGTGPFNSSVSETTKTQELEENTYLSLNSGLKQLVDDDKRLTGFLLDYKTEPILNAATDSTGRPLFIDTPLTDPNPAIRPGRLIGRPAYMGDNVASGDTVAFGGDWTQIAWGVVGGISYDVSQETALPLGANGEMVSLWAHNLVAVRAEAEYGLIVNDPEAFVAYENAVANGS